MAFSCQVFVDDNYHYMEEEYRYKLGDFTTFDEAVAVCQKIVDEFLARGCKQGVTAAELYASYIGFGEDPFIVGKSAPFSFSARSYAKERSREICAEVRNRD